METSQAALNQCLNILIISSTIVILIVGAFLVKFLSDLSKLVKTLDETVDTLKEESCPLIKEVTSTMGGVSAIINNFDKNLSGASKFFGGFTTAGLLAFTKARALSKGALKKGAVWLISLIKLFTKK